jgi:hypothetical protein
MARHAAAGTHQGPVLVHHARLQAADGQQQRHARQAHGLVFVVQQLAGLVPKLLNQLWVLLQDPAGRQRAGSRQAGW